MARIDIQFNVKKQIIEQRPKVKIVAGGQNYFYAVFNLCGIWNNIDYKKAVFKCGKNSYIVDLVPNNNGMECLIPWEVMQEPGFFDTGIFGGSRLPTNLARTFVIEGCVSDGKDPQPPTQDWFIKIENDIKDKVSTVNGQSPDEDGNVTLEITNGKDGYSPTIAVDDIEGGHRVTITDKDGAKKFDVMDGQGDPDGAQSDWNAKEGEPGYVKNRTHWVDIERSLVTYDGTSDGLERHTVMDDIYWVKVSNNTHAVDELLGSTVTYVDWGSPMSFVIDDSVMVPPGDEFGYHVRAEDCTLIAKDFPKTINVAVVYNEFDSFSGKMSAGTWFRLETGMHLIWTESLSCLYDENKTYHTIDPGFLPDTVPTEDRVIELINETLEVIENGSY